MGSLFSMCFSSGPKKGHPSSIVIKNTTYKLTKLLGEGGYAFVYKGHATAGPSANVSVAIKRFVLQSNNSSSEQDPNSTAPSSGDKTLREVEIQKALSPHPNIVRYISHEVVKGGGAGGNGGDELWVVMELCSGGSLQDALNAQLSSSSSSSNGHAPAVNFFTPVEILEIVSQVVAAIGHMHSASPNALAHWDLKLDNLLFAEVLASDEKGGKKMDSGTFKVKLCDFGSATSDFVDIAGSSSSPSNNSNNATKLIYRFEAELDDTMTLLYRSPESLDLWTAKEKQWKVDTKSDIWSLGVICYVLLYRKMPFDENKQSVLDARVPWEERPPAAIPTAASVSVINGCTSAPDAEPALLEQQQQVTAGDGYTLMDNLQSLTMSMLEKDPDQRPSIHEVSERLNSFYQQHVPLMRRRQTA